MQTHRRFVYDAIEPFRPWVDRLVAELALQGAIAETWTEPKDNGIWLTRAGKQTFIPAWLTRLSEATLFNGRRIRRRDQIQHLLTTLAQQLLKEHRQKPPEP